jgi:sugar O-acyltransferase (sialic acid O-acetyltransferase NeuD family)
MASRPVIVLGAGGHAKVVINALQMAGAEILGAVDPDPAIHATSILGVSVLGSDDVVLGHTPDAVALINGVGSTAPSSRRKDLFRRFFDAGYAFAPVIHPSAVIGGDVEMADAVQIMAGVVVQPGCRIGANAIINTRASVDHDCVIGDHVHIAPGAVLGGGITIGEGSHIGAGSTVIQNVRVGESVMVAAGAVVVTDVPNGARIAGVPAREM